MVALWWGLCPEPPTLLPDRGPQLGRWTRRQMAFVCLETTPCSPDYSFMIRQLTAGLKTPRGSKGAGRGVFVAENGVDVLWGFPFPSSPCTPHREFLLPSVVPGGEGVAQRGQVPPRLPSPFPGGACPCQATCSEMAEVC